MLLYDERRITLRPGVFPSYRRWALHELWPALLAAGHSPVCLLNGLIGKTADEVILIVGFQHFEARQAAQSLFAGDGPSAPTRRLVVEEEVKIILAHPERAPPLNAEDRRPIYGVRRWWIQPEDWEEFFRLSLEGIWPAMDHMGHYVLGMFRDSATPQSGRLECVNLAGYEDAHMWQDTRNPAAHDVPSELLMALETKGRARNALVLESYVCLMSAHWPEDDVAASADIMSPTSASL